MGAVFCTDEKERREHVEPMLPPATANKQKLGGGWVPDRAKASSPQAIPKSAPSISRDQDRVDKYLDRLAEAADSWNPRCATCLRVFQPLVVLAVKLVMCLWPFYQSMYTYIYDVASILPMNVLTMLFGAALCFFGGTFVASIAAIEAFRTMGGEKSLADFRYIMGQVNLVSFASREDDKIDANKDGIADVDQMDSGAYAQHKLRVAMLAMDEPEKLQSAVASLWAASLAVLATLHLEFARTTALAVGIAEMVKFPAIRLFAPVLSWSLGSDLQHWVDTIIDSTLKIFAILFAWIMQQMITAFYSGLRGGKMFAAGVVSILEEKDILRKLPSFLVADKEPFNAVTTHVDELIAYPLAAVGFYWQITSGFSLGFPLNIIFLPLTIVEYFLRIVISWS